MKNIVFLDRDTIGPTVSITKPSAPHQWQEYDRTSAEQVAERAKDAEVIVTNKVPIRADSLQRLPNLKLIVVAATGYDIIDMDACRERGILVSNVRGYATNTVPEHVLALMFALRRSIVGYRQDVIAGEWQRAQQFCFFNHPIKDLTGSTLGIIGRGALGQSLGNLAKGLGMRVLFGGRKGQNEPSADYVSFETLLSESDIISLHCPLNDETRNLIAYPEFQKMSRRPLLINTGRGGLVNETDLVRAVEEGLVSGVGFDCVTSEPITDDHPFYQIIERPNVIITPHVAWASEEAMQSLWNQVIDHINNFYAGSPSNLLN